MHTDTNPSTAKNHVCPHKFAFMLDNWARRLLQNPLKTLKEYLRPGDRVVDLGCGPGFFTIDMAKMVGPEGHVIAVDLQAEMLGHVRRKAAKHGVGDRITCHQCRAERIGLDAQADFILAFYMIHETPDIPAYLAQVKTLMKPEAQLLVVEPKMHVGQQAFEEMVVQAEAVGLKATHYPPKKGGRAVVFTLK